MKKTWSIAPTDQERIFVLQLNGRSVVKFEQEYLEDFIELIAVYSTAQRQFPNSFAPKSNDTTTAPGSH